MKKNNIFLILIVSLMLYSCQSIKDGLSGSKAENSDEFLVEKKNALILPPQYSELPKPGENDSKEKQLSESSDIEKIITGEQNNRDVKVKNYGSAEEFVLKNINKN